MKKLFLLGGIFAALSILTISAQVSIGINETPVPGAMLQLKSVEDAASQGNANATQGVEFPRVALVVRDQLQPMYSASEAPNLSNVVKMNHRGLVVYNITDDVNAELSPGLYQWDGTQWTGMAQKPTAAVVTFPTNCNEIMVNGDYFDNSPLNSSNFITIPLNVTKAGYYAISLAPDPDNGYYFTTSGTFMTTGPISITLQGAGQPKNFTPNGDPGDALALVCNGDTVACTPYIFVQDGSHKPNFAMSCNSIVVVGSYKKGILPPTPESETIKLRINVSDGAQGALWSAKTDVIDGLSFEGSGTLGAAGPQDIVLYAKGAPQNTASKNFTITTNSQSTTATCNVTITPVIAAKKIVAVGSTTYGLTSGGANGCGAMINDNMNFGDDVNSIVKYAGFASVDVQTSLPTNLETAGWTSGSYPYDIIVITYAITPTPAQRAQLVTYVNNGGVLIYLDQTNSINNVQVIGDIFGETYTSSNIVSIGSTCNQVITMNSGVNDMISNGPFGDVRNGQWGEDFANSMGITIVPFGAIVYAGAVNASTGLASSSGARVTILRHPTKNFFWCGDSGLIHGGNSTTSTDTPFWIGARVINGVTYPNYPVDKPNYGSQAAANRLPVCNSTLFANVMAWAVKMAEENGINSGR